MNDILDQINKETGVVAPNNEELQEISRLANLQLELEMKVSAAEGALDRAKEELRQVQENLLPEAMLNCGMAEFKMENGLKIKVKEDTHPSIRKEFLGEAISWLDCNNLGGIVKDDVSVKFGRGESDRANQLIEFCKMQGFNAEEKLSVHPSTLKATVKEQMAKGVVFPEEFFSIYSSRKAEIKTK